MIKQYISYMQYICVAVWLFLLIDSKSYYMPYFVVGLGSFYCISRVEMSTVSCSMHEKGCIILGSILFSFAVSLANYDTFVGSFFEVVLFVLGYMTIKPIFVYLVKITGGTQLSCKYDKKYIFSVCFAVIAIIDIFVLFTSFYPGVLTPDSVSQMNQLSTGVYSNHHPYYHTQIIHVIYNIGRVLFGTPNKSVAFYSVCQIVIISAIFSYVLTTIYQRNNQIKWVIIGCGWYVLMPFHVMYSFTMWKDIMWSGMITLFIVSIYRLFYDMGWNRINYCLLTISSVGICLLRSNGLFVYAGLVIIFTVIYIKNHPKIVIIMLCVLLSSYVLKYPILERIGVTQPDTIESLSIPAQQIARVITDGNALSDEQYELLSYVIDIEKVPETYLNYISDPIKNLVREKTNQEYIVENKIEFIKLWVRLGIKYPDSYIKGWIDQTRGYWNGGYNYWTYSETIETNDLNIFQENYFPEIQKMLSNYGKKFATPFFCIFNSIGFHVWLVAGVFVIALARKRLKEAYLCVPLLLVVASLIIATPVFSEFRYAYCVFTSMPIILSLLEEKESSYV